MNRKLIRWLLLLFLLSDLTYSFVQHFHSPLDGDMVGGILPDEGVEKVLNNPLGIEAIAKQTNYPNPNRFFSHWLFYQYFNHVPLCLQHFINPIDSLYVSCALAKTFIQLAILFLLSLLVVGSIKIDKLLLAAAIITPLFQTNGYSNYMGIIDSSITYTFFYALPAIFLLVYFIPVLTDRLNSKFTLMFFFWILVALISSLSGPLNPAVSLIIVLLVVIKFLIERKVFNNLKQITHLSHDIKLNHYLYFFSIALFSAYSLYLGKYNSVSIEYQKPLVYLYSRLPEGMYYLFTRKPGFMMIFLILILNVLIIKYKFKTTEGGKILDLLKWALIFIAVYIILLPLGGYRDYRPNVLRYDTALPITLSLIFMFGKTTFYILQQTSPSIKFWYKLAVLSVLIVFMLADKPKFDRNLCQRKLLHEMSQSKEAIVKLSDDCFIMSWTKISKPEKSAPIAKLLKRWNITKEEKLFYQE